MNYLRWSYPDAPVEGYWGEVTSTIDWCEENYVVSSYIAEWSNTLTNAVFVSTALYTTYAAYRSQLETKFILIGLGFALVGIGSWLFHMSLSYNYQLLDELPMLYATCIPSWSMICEFTEYLDRPADDDTSINISKKRQVVVGSIIFIGVTSLSVLYIIFKKPAIHQIAYALLNICVAAMSFLLTQKKIKDKTAISNLHSCMVIGTILFLVGFIAWNLDNQFCSLWIHIRRKYLLLPFGAFFELHGWWHLLTGTGVYYYIMFLQYLRILTIHKGEDYKFIWRWGFIPEVIQRDYKPCTNYSLTLNGPYVIEEEKKNQ
ncbi:hypothetical protein TPHA_0L01840 [Tetrapisispora phaffii CBS 4417]|uniref:Alkaline ceramidase n=1 Tax=Tetrapisispora phaffii (strain ATCC 24235 / CBS 4417 / NBRC 1672 / NRRL Y-8282 / UCD 70-5) TaxID=1071381 RepID=G8C059_TETPH|nr:hypothetical protein TPHA_0L01840 [Tetrapisispora phaffii CBS 4417]CCE65537.1 hypothetical protein TPHA_0L01840 [Tetrapisispora phaffii CBS 4417]